MKIIIVGSIFLFIFGIVLAGIEVKQRADFRKEIKKTAEDLLTRASKQVKKEVGE